MNYNQDYPMPYGFIKTKHGNNHAVKITDRERENMREDRKKGLYLKDIAKKYGRSNSTVHDIVKDV